MTNYENQKEDIIKLIKTTRRLAVRKSDGKVCDCCSIECSDCELYRGVDTCNSTWVEWVNTEYVEPKHFTEKEKKVVEACENIKYFVRESNGELYGYTEKPTYKYTWVDGGYVICISNLTNEPFNAIKSTDREPTSREEILNS